MTWRSLILAACACLGVSVCQQALAQTASAGMIDNPCPPAPPPMPREMMRAMLQPGAKPPMAAAPQANDPAYQAYLKLTQEQRARDFANLCKYKADNAALKAPPRVVFMGDSITEGWQAGDPQLFATDTVDRGISGQTSPQMLLRFYQDVVALRPRVVHIMAGTNDVAGNTGPTSPADFLNNVRAMIDLAQAHGIRVMLSSILPADHFFWNADLHPAHQIADLNGRLKALAAERNAIWVDYYGATATPAGSFRPELSNDGVHPNLNGYATMRPIYEAALRQALAR